MVGANWVHMRTRWVHGATARLIADVERTQTRDSYFVEMQPHTVARIH